MYAYRDYIPADLEYLQSAITPARFQLDAEVNAVDLDILSKRFRLSFARE